MTGVVLVTALNLITALAYVGIVTFILRGLVKTRQLLHNRFALVAAFIFVLGTLNHVNHALDLIAASGPNAPSVMRAVMSSTSDVVEATVMAVAGVAYLAMSSFHSPLLRSPSIFDNASEARYRQLAANLPDTVVLLVDCDLRFVLAEGAGMASEGITPQQLEGRLLRDTVTPEQFAELVPHFQMALAGHASDFDTISPLTGRTFRSRARPLRDETGRVVGALVLAGDVTAEREAEAELNRTRQFRDAVLAASPDVTTITDVRTGALNWASRSISSLLTGSPTGRSGRWPELNDPTIASLMATESDEVTMLAEDAEGVRAAEREVAALPDGQSMTTRYRVQLAGGGIRWLSRRSTPFRRDSSGEVLQVLSAVREVTEIVSAEGALQHAALHDPLTGLPNRTLLLDRIGLAIDRGERTGGAPAVLFCDLDGFKRINDVDGHSAGDAVLTEVARRLRTVLRSGDSIARVGGDEFVIIVDAVPTLLTGPVADDRGVDTALLVRFAERVSAALIPPIVHRGRAHVVSASIGVALGHHGSKAQDVLREADIAMYRAKQRGKNRIELFDEALRSEVGERAHIERTLRHALSGDGVGPTALSVVYQPVHQLGSGRLTSFEALARLRDHTGNEIAPEHFIPVAEDTGLIGALGARVLDDALGVLVRWRATHPNPSPRDPAVTVAVNLSGRQAQHANMKTVVGAALRQHGLLPTDLVLELTESVLLESESCTLAQLVELRATGVGISIDDFGTGYASLTNLASLPVSAVKIDRSFTATMTSDATSGSIVRAIIGLARELNLGCVVEGIESTDQLRTLPGWAQGQGYLLGRPDPTPNVSWGIPAPCAHP